MRDHQAQGEALQENKSKRKEKINKKNKAKKPAVPSSGHHKQQSHEYAGPDGQAAPALHDLGEDIDPSATSSFKPVEMDTPSDLPPAGAAASRQNQPANDSQNVPVAAPVAPPVATPLLPPPVASPRAATDHQAEAEQTAPTAEDDMNSFLSNSIFSSPRQPTQAASPSPPSPANPPANPPRGVFRPRTFGDASRTTPGFIPAAEAQRRATA